MPCSLPEFVGHVVDQHFVEVVAAQVRVTTGAQHLEHLGVVASSAAGHFQYGHVKRTATQVEDDDLLVLLLVQSVGQCRGGRFVDDAHHLQTGDLARVLGGLTLRVVEVGRHRDDGLVHLVTQIRFGRLLQLAQGLGRDLLRRVLFAVDHDLDIIVAAHR